MRESAMTQDTSQLLDDRRDDDLVLSLDAFVRAIGVRRNSPLSVFLGAGASVSSGLPSAQMCIWEWKRSIFLTNNPGLEDQFTELSLPGIRRRIQQWLDGQGRYPTDGRSDEYGFFIQECFPIVEDRRIYFQEKVRSARPHVGYQLLCQLSENGHIRSVWSTNFDGLAARAAASFSVTPLEVGIDSQQRLARQPEHGELLCVSLHGDYRYDELKNTDEELQSQEAALRAALIDETRTMALVVAGYSGRDQSVMEALHAGYAQSGKGNLFWCGFGDGDIPENVAALIGHARKCGRQAYYVPTLGFDDLMTRLALHCLHGEQREAARQRIAALAPSDVLRREVFQVPQHSNETLIKSNAFEIECPAEVLQFDLKCWPTKRVWASLREAAGERPLIAVPFRKVLALGTVDDVRDAFADNIKGAVERTPVTSDDLRFEDGAVVSLMRQALVRSMAEAAGLQSDGSRTLWRSEVMRTVHRGNARYSVHESVGGISPPSGWCPASGPVAVAEGVRRTRRPITTGNRERNQGGDSRISTQQAIQQGSKRLAPNAVSQRTIGRIRVSSRLGIWVQVSSPPLTEFRHDRTTIRKSFAEVA